LLTAASPEWELPLRLFATNAQRLVEAMRALQTTPEVDVTLGWSPDFRVREFGGYQKGLSFDRIRQKFSDGTWKDQDLEAMARHAGFLLQFAERRDQRVLALVDPALRHLPGLQLGIEPLADKDMAVGVEQQHTDAGAIGQA
jgi:hypothetical protein